MLVVLLLQMTIYLQQCYAEIQNTYCQIVSDWLFQFLVQVVLHLQNPYRRYAVVFVNLTIR